MKGEIPALSAEWCSGFVAGATAKKSVGEHSEEWLSGFNVGDDFRRGQADGRSGRLATGAQSRAWEAGYHLGSKN
jgi:hypothetical protein